MKNKLLSLLLGIFLISSIAFAASPKGDDSPRGQAIAEHPSPQKPVVAKPLKGKPQVPATTSGVRTLDSISVVAQGSVFIVIDDINFYITSTDGYIRVDSAYASETHIPISKLYADPSVGYFFEKSDEPTGTTLSGNGYSFTPSYPTYPVFYDDQVDTYFAAQGSLYLLPYYGDYYLHLYHPAWVDVSFQASNGNWVTQYAGGGYPLYSTASEIGPWEIFHVCASDTGADVQRAEGWWANNDTVSMLANINSTGGGWTSYWICAEGYSPFSVGATRSSAGAWEHFSTGKYSGSAFNFFSDDIVALQASTNNFWTNSGHIYASSSTLGSAQYFTVQISGTHAPAPPSPYYPPTPNPL